jgi:phage terminase small subunit
MSLSAKHLDFCQNIAAGYSQTEAYIKAGYARKAANVNAARLIAKDNIRAEVDRLQTKASNKAEVTLESMIADMQSLYDMAVDKGDVNAAIKAKSEQSKLVGLYAPTKTENKTEVTGDMQVNTNKLADEAFAAAIKQARDADATSAVH